MWWSEASVVAGERLPALSGDHRHGFAAATMAATDRAASYQGIL